MQEMEIKLEE